MMITDKPVDTWKKRHNLTADGMKLVLLKDRLCTCLKDKRLLGGCMRKVNKDRRTALLMEAAILFIWCILRNRGRTEKYQRLLWDVSSDSSLN